MNTQNSSAFAVRCIMLGLACSAVLLSCAPKTKSPKSEAAGASLLGEAEAAIFNETGYPIVSKPITLKTVYPKQASHGDLDQMPTLQLLQEVSGINLDIEQIPGTGYDTKISLMFAGGELPDLIPSWGPGNLINYIELLRPLGGYIDSYMPNLLNIFAPASALPKGATAIERRNVSTADGCRKRQYSDADQPVYQPKMAHCLGACRP